MITATRRFRESPIEQGKDERVAYEISTTPWGGTPSSVVVVIYDDAGTDVSATKLSGSATTDGDDIITPFVISPVDGTEYRLEVKFTSGGNVFEAFGFIRGTG